MGNERLSGLMLMYIEKDFVKTVKMEEFDDDFTKMRPSRYSV